MIFHKKKFASILTLVFMLALCGFAPHTMLVFKRSFGDFNHPKAATWDQLGNLYVVDTGNDRVVKYSPSGDSIASIGTSGFDVTQFQTPDGIAVTGVDVYVADYGNHRIQRFNRNLDYIATLYTRENPTEAQRFGYPKGVAASSQGDLFILDGENIRILQVNAFNVIEKNFGSIDAGAERLLDPSQIITDASDRIYVRDGDVIKMFDIYGNPTGMLSNMFAPPMRGCAVYGNTLYVLSDSVITIVTLGDAEQNAEIMNIPDKRPWEAIAVSAKTIALFDDHAVYEYNRQ